MSTCRMQRRPGSTRSEYADPPAGRARADGRRYARGHVDRSPIRHRPQPLGPAVGGRTRRGVRRDLPQRARRSADRLLARVAAVRGRLCPSHGAGIADRCGHRRRRHGRGGGAGDARHRRMARDRGPHRRRARTAVSVVGDVDVAALRVLAERLAVDAGELALDGRRRLGVGRTMHHDTKSSATDPVTEFDRAAEDLIVDGLGRERPDDAIVGEEGAARTGSTGLEWHVDPIDGTVNYVYDLPAWCTSVAVVDADGPLAGAVFAPVAGELFSAARGQGATPAGVPSPCPRADGLPPALVATGFSSLPERRRCKLLAWSGSSRRCAT